MIQIDAFCVDALTRKCNFYWEIICHTLIEEMVVLGNALCFFFEKESYCGSLQVLCTIVCLNAFPQKGMFFRSYRANLLSPFLSLVS